MASGSDFERFMLKTTQNGKHLLWLAGCQFRFADGHRCTPVQAAYRLMTGKDIGPEEAVWRVCDREHCVAHVRRGNLHELGISNRTLPTDLVRRLRAMPDLRGVGTRKNPVLPTVAKHYGVSVGAIYRARQGQTYADITV